MVTDFIVEAAAAFLRRRKMRAMLSNAPSGSFARGPKETIGGRRIYFSRRRDSL